MLHPELARLQEQYNAVLDEHEAGNLSYDDALMTVQAMSVLDGGGFVWMIDPVSGAFLRAVPGEQPIEADPSQFAPAQIPAPGSSPWASQQDLLRPPAHLAPTPQYADDLYDDSFDARPGAQSSTPSAGQNPYPNMGNRRPSRDDGPTDRRPRPSFQPEKILAALRNVPLPPLIARNKKMAAIVAGVAVVVLIAVSRGGDAPSAPSVTPETQPPATVPANPATPGAAVPTVEQRMAVFVELISGDRTRVAAMIAAPGDARTIALQTARLYGYQQQTNLKLKFAAEPTVAADGAVLSEVQLLDRTTDEVYATITVTWTLGPDQRWRLATYPVFE